MDEQQEEQRYWYVVVDDTPVNPEDPLTLEQALTYFEFFVNNCDDPDEKIEIHQCNDEDLTWASS